MSKEPRYTRAEWEKLRQEDRIIANYRVTGIRIASQRVYDDIMMEIHAAVDPSANLRLLTDPKETTE